MRSTEDPPGPSGPGLLSQAYAELAPEVRAWIHARRGKRLRDAHDEDDVAQEVWLRVARAARRFDPARGSLRAWVHRIAQHALLDHLRQGERAPLGLDALELVHGGSAPDCGADALALLEELVALERVDRRLLWLRAVEGRTSSEAARELALGVEATRKRWWRLRHRLARRTGLAR